MLKPGLDDWVGGGGGGGVSDIQDNFHVVGPLSHGDGEKMAAEAALWAETVSLASEIPRSVFGIRADVWARVPGKDYDEVSPRSSPNVGPSIGG